MNRLQFNVYSRKKGSIKKIHMAKFGTLVDAINFAFDCSRGRYLHDDITMIAFNHHGKVARKFYRGEDK